MRIATWNLERKTPTSPRGSEAIDYLHARQADVLVITEGRMSFPTNGGHLLWTTPPLGSRFAKDERKVLVWSRNELEPVKIDSPIDDRRFVAARTVTPIGKILIVAVCIPWHMAEVTYHTNEKKKPWQEHHEYLVHLKAILESLDEPTVIAGDFNQRYPRVQYGNRAAAEALAYTFDGTEIATAGVIPGCEKPGIDHIAIGPGLRVERVEGWPNDVTGNRLSDHDGALVEVAPTG